MIVSQQEIVSISDSTGFRDDIVEKVLQLLNLLNKLNSHSFLKGKLALKGGTALNLFVLDIPRLSVDIDLNYIGSLDREHMLSRRPKVDQAVQAVFSREGFTVRQIPGEHAGGKWRLTFQSFTGQSANLEVDLNFMFRQPLWDVQTLDSHALGDHQAKNIPVIDIHELAAGKLAALFARHQARDLFDAHQLLCHGDLDMKRLRVAFVVYGALNRKDWRTISLEDITFETAELKNMLTPVIHRVAVDDKDGIEVFAQRLVNECKQNLSAIYPFSEQEMDFLDGVIAKGKIEPSLITTDKQLQARIVKHPMLLWKVMNVNKHFENL